MPDPPSYGRSMGLIKKRIPEPPVVLPDHAAAALEAMVGHQTPARTWLGRVVSVLMAPERVLACGENLNPWTSIPSLWVITNRRLFEVREDQTRHIPLAYISAVGHGQVDIDFVVRFTVSEDDAGDWTSYIHRGGQLVFASHETRDGKGLLRAFDSMFGL